MLPLAFGGHDFAVVGGTALFWPSRAAIIVADLHLEKASWFAARGQMLPPYDSRATIEWLAELITHTAAREVWCLGDNFHDDHGPKRLPPDARARLAALTASVDWYWITGNHDAHLPSGIGGAIAAEAEVDGIMLRHEATASDPLPELSGHYHPKYRAAARGRAVSRPCFVASETRMILPAAGAFTGGLFADHPEILRAVGAAKGETATAYVPTQRQLLGFALTPSKGLSEMVRSA